MYSLFAHSFGIKRELRYQYAEWKEARVHIDYHVEVHKHYYFVLHCLIGWLPLYPLVCKEYRDMLHIKC